MALLFSAYISFIMIDLINERALISIVVVTYNSYSTVLDTLESIHRQSYHNIELIVSDDCSTDNTIQICNDWISKHKDRFKRALCTRTPHNNGICWNYNHALKFVSGNWIKFIAGDDILWDNCIQKFFHNIRPNVFLYYSGQQQKYDIDERKEYTIPKIPNISAKGQLYLILRYTYGIHGATMFVHRKKTLETCGFDEKYPMIEDRPVTYKFLVNNLSIGLIYEVLVTWFVHQQSVSHSGSSQNIIFTKDMRDVEFYYRNRYCLQYGLLLQWFHCRVNYYIDTHYNNGIACRLFGYLLRIIDILYWYRLHNPVQSVEILTNYQPKPPIHPPQQ